MSHPPLTIPQLLVLPAAWVSMEFLRSHLLSGFGWNLLAYSQTRWVALIQLAEVSGAWGVSFLIVLVNAALAHVLLRRVPERLAIRGTVLAGVCVAIAAVFGTWRIPRVAVGPAVRVAVVQGNIPQEEKWDEAHREAILQRYDALTRRALEASPQLIVWPETSAPGFVGVDEPLTQRLLGLARSVRIPLLLGAPMGRFEGLPAPPFGGAPAYPATGVAAGRQAGPLLRQTNSAVLVDREGVIRQRYDKLHLVPFGEFIPFEHVAPWLRAVLPPIGDFVSGHDYTVFRLGSGFRVRGSGQAPSPQPPTPNPELQFSVLICFEDIFPGLARRFIQAGAQGLFVITNDAWFGPTAAAYQHAQASTFRAVELRVPVMRAANTGWSGCIDAVGRWVGSVKDASGRELFVQGTHTCDLPTGASGSLYVRWGDWFAGFCLVGTASWLLVQRLLVGGPLR